MYAVWVEESLTQASVQALSQRGLTKPAISPCLHAHRPYF